MRRHLGPILAVSGLLLGVAAAPAGALDRATLNRVLAREQDRFGASSGAMVVDLASRSTLYAAGAQRPLTPASNEKLFVTAAALLRLGPAARLETTVVAAPGATLDEDGRLRGDLYLVGGGDPTLGDEGLADLARQVRKTGVRRITGGLFGDESAFDRRRGGPDTGYGYDGDLGGALGALVWAHGTSRDGSPAYAAVTRFGAKLKAVGVRYARAPRVSDLPAGAGGGAAAGAAPLATVRSPTIRELAARTNVPSENFYAEMLAKALGDRFGPVGSTRGGLRVVARALAPFSITPTLVDGSGLSRANRTTALQITALLAGMHASDAGDAFRASLPVAGLSGTLVHRMRRTAAAGRCRAKTGTLIGVSSLSGYCVTRGGRSVAFSLLENGVCSACAKRVEDRMVAAIARLD